MISAVGEGRVCRSFRLRRRRSPTQQGGEDGVAGEEGHGQRRAGAGAAQKETSLDGERGGSKNGLHSSGRGGGGAARFWCGLSQGDSRRPT